jgi:hypothetical protein
VSLTRVYLADFKLDLRDAPGGPTRSPVRFSRERGRAVAPHEPWAPCVRTRAALRVARSLAVCCESETAVPGVPVHTAGATLSEVCAEATMSRCGPGPAASP